MTLWVFILGTDTVLNMWFSHSDAIHYQPPRPEFSLSSSKSNPKMLQAAPPSPIHDNYYILFKPVCYLHLQHPIWSEYVVPGASRSQPIPAGSEVMVASPRLTTALLWELLLVIGTSHRLA
jgi:hypothetical protein